MYGDDETRELRPYDRMEPRQERQERTGNAITALGALMVLVMLVIGTAIVLGFAAGLWWLLFGIGWGAIQ